MSATRRWMRSAAAADKCNSSSTARTSAVSMTLIVTPLAVTGTGEYCYSVYQMQERLGGEVVYYGLTRNPKKRLSQHKADGFAKVRETCIMTVIYQFMGPEEDLYDMKLKARMREDQCVVDALKKGLKLLYNKEKKQEMNATRKTFSCTQCGKVCDCKSAQIRHMLTHSEDRPYKCTECGHAAKFQGSLNAHIRQTHRQERPYQCDQCPLAFKVRHSLTDHMVTHTGEKAHIGDICGKAFGLKSNLQSHKVTHSDERPYACNACPLAFKLRQALKRHKQSQHAGHIGHAKEGHEEQEGNGDEAQDGVDVVDELQEEQEGQVAEVMEAAYELKPEDMVFETMYEQQMDGWCKRGTRSRLHVSFAGI